MEPINILVTGAAGDIGRGMSKILKEISWVNQIYGMDINEQFPANYFFNGFIKGPKITEKSYLSFLEGTIEEFNINMVIPASEIEIRYFMDNKINRINNIPILMASSDVMEIGFDKLETAKFLKDNDMPFPETTKVKNNSNVKLPCIIKSRDGSGSKTVELVTENNYEYYKENFEEWIFQELILPEEEEYTCGLFKSKLGSIQKIIFKRVLHGDRTGYAEVVRDTKIENLLDDFCSKLSFQGSINIQLRMSNKEIPVIFEINPRFSSTLVFRHLLGFKDLEWSIKDKINCLEDIEFDIDKIANKKIFRSDCEIIYY
ncbi:MULTISPECIES: ATP-grasp domain-containing protein [unclassified Sporosarcina]|uniref:ATP-grasp domain-containing protein n=1 Tax=unclassified Sporosarcina TaxID=2647733 RepID=UPI0020413ABD|nr:MULTISPECIES: ATP-grasp domain-containing protein [unclassified Sporosarcina]GKV64854.1 carbamoyl phosphate synthase [Sporosarcina sp. NCCP-2331]GLB54964.1 carbamoyl phosphate synthase [Sporosarcina sp. NCCP-2378]